MIVFYDKNMNELPEMDFIEIAWNRKWNEPGNFSVYTTIQCWNPNIKFVKNLGRPETGIVQKIAIESKPEGTFITATGYFAEQALFWAVLRNDLNINASSDIAENIESKLIKNNAYRQAGEPYENFIADIEMNKNSKLPNAINISGTEGMSLGEALYNYLLTNGLSYTVSIEKGVSNNSLKYVIETLEEKDLSDKVYFGTGFGNAAKIEYIYDDSGAIPYIEIRQTMDETGFSNETVIVDDSGNRKGRIKEFVFENNNVPLNIGAFPKRIVEGSVSGIELKPGNEKNIREQLKQKAREELLNNYKVDTISVDTLQNTFFYLQDYDLGSTCGIVFDELQKTFNSKIVEISEVHSKNKVDIKLLFGTPRKTQYIKVNI